MKLLALTCAFVTLTWAVVDAATNTVAVIHGTVADSYDFRYSGYDAQGSLVVTGRLSLAIATNMVTGTWSFNPVGQSNDRNPQVGSGQLKGSAKGSHLRLNLNPGWLDNNVWLQGDVSGSRFTGTWDYSTIAGVVAEGKFVAEMP